MSSQLSSGRSYHGKVKGLSAESLNDVDVGGDCTVAGDLAVTGALSAAGGLTVASGNLQYPRFATDDRTIAASVFPGGFVHSTGTGDITLPSAASILATYGAPATDACYMFTIFNNSLTTSILVLGVDLTVYGSLDIAANTAAEFVVRVLSPTTVRMYRVDSPVKITHVTISTPSSSITPAEFHGGIVDVAGNRSTSSAAAFNGFMNTSVTGSSMSCLFRNATAGNVTITPGTGINIHTGVYSAFDTRLIVYVQTGASTGVMYVSRN